jgi:hypothetical protein
MTIPLPVPTAIPAADLERLEREFHTYRRALPRLVAEGYAGKFALLHEGQILGLWDTHEVASQEGRGRFGLVPISVKKIDPRDLERLALLDARAEAPCRS